MRAARIWTTGAAAAFLGAVSFGTAAYLSFREALSARIERAVRIEASAAKPGAAARLAAALAERRLALVSEEESRAVAGAFRRGFGSDALEAYRKAGGDPAVVREAEAALSAEKPAGSAGDVAFLRAIRKLREEASRMPVPAPPEPPASAAKAKGRLLWAGACALLASFLAFLAGRSV